MNRGPHYLPNWTPLSSLPRHVQHEIELKSIKFETPPTLEDLKTAPDDANADVGGQNVEDNNVAEKGKKQEDIPKDIKELKDIGHPGEEVSLPSDIVDATTAKGSGVPSDNANGADKGKQLQLRAAAMVALDAMIAFTSMDLD
ncbi:hypothetical protein QBC46DRAFT_388446 [Diplogelasinospora grovesii]|uniref:Uncharacterized protein n=1 Tax=Diplogelasinospora grovesii TaxID=303347 RepID=A0AAN6S2Z0_9PEZI|nr:hypothetical protein QBC46DRAFT_388446 [Diplogelasinospora grovesii]